jgi:hypothetical protein
VVDRPDLPEARLGGLSTCRSTGPDDQEHSKSSNGDTKETHEKYTASDGNDSDE